MSVTYKGRTYPTIAALAIMVIARETLDPVVLARLQSKRKVQDMLLEYLKSDK